MKTSKTALEAIKKHEGLAKRRADGLVEAYLCPAKVVTIGYGTTASEHRGLKMGDIWTVEQCEAALIKSVENFERAVLRNVKVALNQNQFDALVSFVYNLGESNFASSTLLKMINQGNFTGAVAQFKRWNKAGGKVLPGLTRRREDEAALFSTPI